MVCFIQINQEVDCMSFSGVELPSNKKFGFFFTFVFLAATAYFYTNGHMLAAYIFIAFSAAFLLVTLLNSDFLLPLNKLWMRFGVMLGIIVSPIIMSVIFFGLFTPIAFFMRLFKRDELCLKFEPKDTHWISRDKPIEATSFKYQF